MAGEEALDHAARAGTLLAQQEGLFRQLFRLDLAGARQRMRGRGDHHQRILHEGFGAHVRAYRGLAHDGEVGDIFGDLFDDGVAIGHRQADLDLGVRLDEPGQQLRHEIVGGADYGDVQVAALQPFHLVEHRLHLLHELQHRARIAQQLDTGVGQVEFLADLLEQGQTDGGLGLLDLHGHRRLRQIQFRCRARMVQMTRDALEDLQLADGDRQHGRFIP